MTRDQAQLMLSYIMLAQPHVRMSGPEFAALDPVFRMIQGAASGILTMRVEPVKPEAPAAPVPPSA